MLLRPTLTRNKEAKFIKARPLLIHNKLYAEAHAFDQRPYGRSFGDATIANIHEIKKINTISIVKLQKLNKFELKQAIDAVVEPDDDGYIARTIDIPLYGYGDDIVEAISALKKEIESLYKDLMEDDQFSTEWLKYKKFLSDRIFPIK